MASEGVMAKFNLGAALECKFQVRDVKYFRIKVFFYFLSLFFV